MSGSSRYFANPYISDLEAHGTTGNEESVDLNEDLKSAKHLLRRIIDEISSKEPPEHADTHGGLYVGSAGIAYALYRLSERAESSEERKELTSLSHRYMRAPLRDAERREIRKKRCAFLLDDAGVLAVGASMAHNSGDVERATELASRYRRAAEHCKPVDYLGCGSDEFFVGRAGYLYGAVWLERELGSRVVPLDTMHELARVTVRSGKEYARLHESPCPLMYAYHDTEYLGAAHGLSSILQVLIQLPDFLDNDRASEEAVRASVDYLLSLQTPSGNFPSKLTGGRRRSRTSAVGKDGDDGDDGDDRLIHWCHGAPGVVYLMAIAYLRWKERRYLESCQRAGELVWRKGLLRKGPGICHGIAGGGYVFLLLYRLTSDRKYLRRAAKFAKFLNSEQFLREARTPDRPYSLYEGIAGTACFLADLLEPNKSAFPFQDVF